MASLKGRVAVITGASSGIGEATARALAAEGAGVALLARRAERLERLADELSKVSGGDAISVTADVTDADGLHRAAVRVRDELGRTDILVNNAGQMLLSPFASGLADEWRRMVEINLLGAMATTHAFLDQLRDGGGDLVNISSVAGRKARTGSSVYSATKWGLNGWSEALRQELQGDGVRVIVVEPGAVETELTDHISVDQVREAAQKMYRDVDALQSEDIAQIVAFAVSRPGRVSINEVLVRPTKQPY